MDMVTVQLATASAMNLVNIAKAYMPGKKGHDELVKTSVEHQQQLLTISQGIGKVVNENIDLRAKVAKLQEELDAVNNFDFKDDMAWRNGVAGAETGPFCQVCWDKDHRRCRLYQRTQSSGGYECKVCGKQFNAGPPVIPKRKSPYARKPRRI